MFENVGEKLGALARVVLALDCIAAVIAFCITVEESFLMAIMMLVVLGLSGVVSAWFLYGFAIIVDAHENKGSAAPNTPSYAPAPANADNDKLKKLYEDGVISYDDYIKGCK